MSISLQNVIKRFHGAAAVDGVSAEAPTGAFFAVLGPSGCGKSTLLRLIAGLERLDGGSVALDGAAVAGPRLHVPPEARRAGVVFQSYALWPHMTVAENVAFPAETAGLPPAAVRASRDRALAAVSMTALAGRRPAELSGGQRQRVALARCLAQSARTILMDEPLANLDPHLRAAMEGELLAFHRAAGATTLYITHDQREAMALADLVAVMRAGRFEQVAPPETVYARPATEHVARFIGRAAVIPAELSPEGPGRARALGAEVRTAEQAAAGPARIVFRPEDVALGEGPGARPSVLRAVAYRGGFWEAEAVVADWPEPLPVASRARIAEGETAPLRITGGWALP
ncbi:MAG: ABC transporter ATP-binding protein [Paracoccaceae bacterium]